MRVLTVARWYPSHDSPGRGSFVTDLVEATARAGADVRVVSFDRVLIRGRIEDREAVLMTARAAYEKVATPEALFVAGVSRGAGEVPVARLPVVRRPGAADSVELVEDHLAALRPFVARLVETWRPDVIHAHTGLPDGIAALEVAWNLGIPLVVSEHMSTIEDALADPVALDRYHRLLGPGVRLLGVSPSLAGRVAARLGVPVRTLGVLPNPVPDRLFPMGDPADRDPDQLLWVGSLGEHKGIDVLIRAFALLHAHRPSLRLRLVGTERAAGERARWEEQARASGLREAVAFGGWMPRDRVAQAMARAAVFVHPSRSETFGVAAAEAILTGLPVAARRSGGVPWIIELSGGFGQVADDEDAESFARAIEMVLDGNLPVDAATARASLVEAIGERSIGRQAFELYRSEIATDVAGRPAATHPAAKTAPTGPTAVGHAPLPRVLVATGRDQGLRLVAELPLDLQRELTLVVPAPTADSDQGGSTGAGSAVRLVEADPIPLPTRRPYGRSPLTRLRGALWHPAPTGDELLARAILAEARRTRTGSGPVDYVALDAPAAAMIERLDDTRVRLAPGALRWLADRWEAR